MESNSGVLFSRGSETNEEESTDEDVWDDTALIEAYDRAVSLAKEEVHRRMGLTSKETSNIGSVTSTAQESHRPLGRKENKKKNQQQKYQNIKVLSASGDQWAIGMACQCAYHEDGLLYEAIIESLSMEDGICMIKFLGYENTQLSSVDELLPTQGRWAQKKQIQEAKASKELAQAEVMDWSESNLPAAKTGKVRKTPLGSNPDMEGFHCDAQPPFSAIPPPPPLSQLSGRLPTEESEALSSMLMSWYLNGFHTGYYTGLKQGKEQTSPRK